MSLTRRHFLALGGSALAASACGRVREASVDLERWYGRPTHPPLDDPLTAPASGEIDAVSHVLNRLTFGARPGAYARVAALGPAAFIEEQLAPERIDDFLCERAIRHQFESLEDPESHLFPRSADTKDPLQLIFPTLRDHAARVGDLYEYKDKVLLNQLTSATILRATLTHRQLYEVMVQFWSDHLNIDPSKGECKWLKTADDRDVIRAHALGNFRDLIRASAVSPAMLWYLDGRANRRKDATEKPNENYARELMELHTLGVHGGYTQRDVMEVARCLTGWTVREKKKLFKGRVEFKAYLHDDGSKQVLGQDIPAGLGARDLDRVLEIVTTHPSTANYIAWKLCRRFIHDDPPAAAVATTAKAFTDSRGDIRTTLRALFATAEFHAPEMRGAKFKRPFHFIVSALRATNAQTDASQQLVEYLQRLGHAPFRYPTPDGYPEEATHWQSTLLWRWNFAAALSEHRIKGTRLDYDELIRRVGGDAAMLAIMLGRQASTIEAECLAAYLEDRRKTADDDEQLRAIYHLHPKQKPAPAQRAAFRDRAAGLAVVLASPAFQRC